MDQISTCHTSQQLCRGENTSIIFGSAQNDGKMCIQCSGLTETYRDEEVHPRYHVYYNDDKNNSKISQRLVYTRIFKGIWQYIFILAYRQEPLK